MQKRHIADVPLEDPYTSENTTLPMSNEEFEELEQEVAQQPTPKPVGTLEVAWDDYINQSGTLAGNELTVADLATGELYSIYVQPATDVSDARIVIYPVVVRYIDDYGRAETFEAAPDGSLTWSDIEKKYFPNGFAKLDKKNNQEMVTGSKRIPDGFWHKVLSNLLKNFSAKSFYSKHLDNPYIVKKNK